MRLNIFIVINLFVFMITACGEDGENQPQVSNDPEINIADNSVTEGDSGTTNIDFVVSLSAVASMDVVIDFTTSDISANAGSDYVAMNNTVTIPAGDTRISILVPVNGDIDIESDESLNVTISNATNAIINIATATGTILNDDNPPIKDPPSLKVSNVTRVEGDAGVTESVFTLSLSEVVSADISVDYVTDDYSATSGADYIISAGTATIQSGNTETTITVNVNGDVDVEANEIFVLQLSNVSAGVVLSDTMAIGTIIDDDAALPATVNLIDGGEFTGLDDIKLKAPRDSIYIPVEIGLVNAVTPTEALPVGTQAVGDYYDLSANRNTFTPHDKPLEITIPVPTGADTVHLALAVLVPLSDVLDNNGAGWTWSLEPGVYDASSNRFFTSLPVVTQEARTLVLVENSDFSSNSPVIASSVVASKNALYNKPEDLYRLSSTPDFHIQCINFITDACTVALQEVVRNALISIRMSFINLEYEEPDLKLHWGGAEDLNGDKIYDGFYAYIYPASDVICNEGAYNGVYLSTQKKLVLCLDGTFDPDDFNTLAHEYFHALQFAWGGPAIGLTGGGENWITEGTAAAAEQSYAPSASGIHMHRTDHYSLRFGDHWLFSSIGSEPFYQYQVQDLWVYAGRVFGNRDLRELRYMFTLGATLAAADYIFKNNYGNPMQEMYWAWVKNQVMEKSEDYSSDRSSDTLGAPCQFDPDLVEKTGTSGGMLSPYESVVYHTQLSGSGVISSLTFWEAFSGDTYGMTNPVRQTDIRYKVYLEGESDCGGGIPDNRRVFTDLVTPADIYVVVSNVNNEDMQLPYQIVAD